MSKPHLVLALTASLFVAAPLYAGNLFVTIPALDFEGGVTDGSFFGGGYSKYCTTGCEIATTVKLPHGASFLGLELDGCIDTVNDKAITVAFLRRLANDQGSPKLQTIATDTFADLGCEYRESEPNAPYELDLFNNEYYVRVRIGTTPCGVGFPDSCPDGGTRFQAVRLYYRANGDGGRVEPSKESSLTVFPE